MNEELLRLQKKLKEVKKKVAETPTNGQHEIQYVEGLKKGLDVALQEIKLCIDISKARAKLEQLESESNTVEIHIPQFEQTERSTAKVQAPQREGFEDRSIN